MLDKIASVIYPHKCTFCGAMLKYNNNMYICPSCRSSLPYTDQNGCLKCGRSLGEFSVLICSDCRKYHHAFSRSFTPLVYSDAVRRETLRMKFYNAHFAARTFAFLIADRISSENYPVFDFITYVPISAERYAERRFDQSKLIAEFLSEIMHVPVVSTLIHIDGVARQSSLSLSERRKNAKLSFRAKDMPLYGTALLIDDIYTTGSTMDACSRLLLKMGCDKVYIAAAAIKIQN